MNEKGPIVFICSICKEKKNQEELLPFELVREPVMNIIQEHFPQTALKGFICKTDLNKFRLEYVSRVIESNKGKITPLEGEVIESLKQQELLSSDVNKQFEKQLTFGERLSDKIAEFGGSWHFLIIFAILLALWIITNSVMLIRNPFDPYPYIFLNLVLSCLAAIQAPLIMMSQNRQEAKDRLSAENDYQTNLKAELEIRHLHEKIDHLLAHQWHKLLEIQHIQTELIKDIAELAK